VAALVWSIAKFVFRLYVLKLIPYGKVYGVLGLIPLTVFWIYITWLIVLFGLQLTFTTQHLKSLNAAEIAAAKKTEEYFIANELTAINILREIITAFGADKAPIEAEVLCSKMNLPGEFGEKILHHLVNKGLIVKTSEPRVGYLPAKEPSEILLSDITSAIAEVSFAQSPIHGSAKLQEINQSQQNIFGQYNLRQILDADSNNLIS
jgi:membrane protein